MPSRSDKRQATSEQIRDTRICAAASVSWLTKRVSGALCLRRVYWRYARFRSHRRFFECQRHRVWTHCGHLGNAGRTGSCGMALYREDRAPPHRHRSNRGRATHAQHKAHHEPKLHDHAHRSRPLRHCKNSNAFRLKR